MINFRNLATLPILAALALAAPTAQAVSTKTENPGAAAGHSNGGSNAGGNGNSNAGGNGNSNAGGNGNSNAGGNGDDYVDEIIDSPPVFVPPVFSGEESEDGEAGTPTPFAIVPPSAVPEPGTLALLGLGLAGLGRARRRSTK